MDLAGVDVEEEAAGGREDAVGFEKAGVEKGGEVVEGIGVACGPGGEVGGDAFGAVAVAAEAGAVAEGIADGAELRTVLAASGVERRVDVDEGNGGGREGLEDVEVVAMEDTAGHGEAGDVAGSLYHLRSVPLRHLRK